MKVSLVTLGCAKNEVDSEMLLGFLRNIDFELEANLEQADCIMINTCGFIKSAKQEAIDTILDMAEYKKIGKCKHLIVVGCLAKRYKKEIQKEFPEVDLVIGVDEYNNIDQIFSKYFSKEIKNKLEFKDRIVSSVFPTAYLRISDGCNNNCHYCAIPLIRGKLKSRKIEDIFEEAKLLVDKGIRELVVIAQDTTSYGLDLYGKPMLYRLLKELSTLEDLKWIRVLYMYPGKITDDLIEEFKTNPKLCKYFDIPLQHISDKMLKAMNRHTNKKEVYELVHKIRKEIPEAVLRTTFMVGYQGETTEDFNELIDAVKDLKFERMGAFTFSKEDDTVAETLPGDVLEKVKKARYKSLMEEQQKVVNEFMTLNIGKKFEVLVTDVDETEKYFICRSYMDAPDVDPKMLLKINKTSIANVVVGEWCDVEITGIKGYDYICKCVKGENDV
ncbi:MAG: 30S ribosomal protein S12 methylthiotransferase RimO [Clostridia bacterium]|nr:30S ribosomal protein S12 methylthiotransferase RimO [Clostridia bacterium]